MRALGTALAGWLWSRGVTEDISGVSLRAAWLGEDDVRRLPRSQVATARFPGQIAAPPALAPAPVDAPSVRAIAVTMPAGPIEPPADVPAARGRRWISALAVVGALGVGAGGALLLTRGTTSQGAPEPAAPATAASSAAPPATATATAVPEPPASVTATATASAAAPPAKRLPPRKPPPGSELQEPVPLNQRARSSNSALALRAQTSPPRPPSPSRRLAALVIAQERGEPRCRIRAPLSRRRPLPRHEGEDA